MLAPNQAIDAHNQTIRESDGWRPLHQPPVIVQSPVRFREPDVTYDRQTVEPDTEEISGFNPNEFEDLQLSVKSSGNYFSFTDDCPPHQLSAVLEGEVEGSSADDTHRIGVESSFSIPLKGMDFAKKMEQELQRDLGVDELAQVESSPQAARKNTKSAPSKPRFTNGRKDSSKEDAVLSLMKEMGTFRNTRQISLFNAGMSAVGAHKSNMKSKHAVQPLKQLDSASYQPNSSVSTYGSSVEILTCNHEGASFKRTDGATDIIRRGVPLSTSKSLDSVSWMKQAGLDGKRGAFLSSICRVYNLTNYNDTQLLIRRLGSALKLS